MPGEVIKADTVDGIVVATLDSAIRVNVQVPGGKRMDSRDYMRGHTIEIGSVFE